ncbi:unnamed protein product [Lampetra fluviatilis]
MQLGTNRKVVRGSHAEDHVVGGRHFEAYAGGGGGGVISGGRVRSRRATTKVAIDQGIYGWTEEEVLTALPTTLDDDGLAVFWVIPEGKRATLQNAYKEMSAVYHPQSGPRGPCKRARPSEDGLGGLHGAENFGVETHGLADHPRFSWSRRQEET